MSRMFIVAGIATMALICLPLLSNSANALPKFKTEFESRYVKDSDIQEFKDAFKKEACNTCHIKGAKTKKDRNAYGNALAELIEGDANERLKQHNDDPEAKKQEEEKILEELKKAFDEVEKQKMDPEKDDSQTYGELFESGKLPPQPEKDE